jgi:hypothetical protein
VRARKPVEEMTHTTEWPEGGKRTITERLLSMHNNKYVDLCPKKDLQFPSACEG